MKYYIISITTISLIIFLANIYTKKSDDDNIVKEYEQFKLKFKKKFLLNENVYRFNIFKENYEMINSYNKNNNSLKLGINQFSDLSNKEFKNLYLMKINFKDKIYFDSKIKFKLIEKINFDWTEIKDAVSPVKLQEPCGSCYTFSTTGTIESYLRIYKKQLTLLSEQEIVDCSKSEGNSGCNGGTLKNSFNYIYKNGLSSDINYPYKFKEGFCKKGIKREIESKTFTSTYAFKNKKDFNEVKNVLEKGPISVCIETNNEFQHYKSGIITPNNSCGRHIDHCLLLVGYGNTNNNNYVKLKNSFGTSWGENGYLKIYFENNISDSCGITSSLSRKIRNK